MGAPRRHLIVCIHRPPFYRPPRSRPVTFEEPNCVHRTRNQLSSDSGRQLDRQKQSLVEMFQPQTIQHKSRILALPDYNRSPRPFVRSLSQQQNIFSNQDNGRRSGSSSCASSAGHNYQDTSAIENHSRRSMAPKIIVGEHHNKSYPTSTVHKSMLTSRNVNVPSQPEFRQAFNNADNSIGSMVMQRQSIGPHDSTSSAYCQSIVESGRQLDQIRGHKKSITFYEPENSGGQQQQTISNKSATYRSLQAIADNHYLGQQHQNHYQTLPSRLERQKSSAKQTLQLCAGTVLPDSKRDEYMRDKQLEQTKIVHQTYRTFPIVSPKPKARHDLASGTYMRYVQDPTFGLDVSQSHWPASSSSSSSFGSSTRKDYERKILEAINNGTSGSNWVS